MSKSSTVKKQPPLHVELSDSAAKALWKIRSRYNWNKKTAVELALQKMADGLTKKAVVEHAVNLFASSQEVAK